jgi:hypothetical protein
LHGWSLSVERLFGAARVDREIPAADGGRAENVSYKTWSFFADQLPHEGYSSPRLATDYVFEAGFSLGGAAGFHEVRGTERSSATVWVLAPRAGYFLHASPHLAFWPRAGMTWLWLDRGDTDEDEAAVTLELPIVALVAEQRLGFMLSPYAELGLPRGDIHLSERGVLFGANIFF